MAYGYKTILSLDGKDYELDIVSYQFEKTINDKGEVTSKVLGGLIYLTILHIPSRNILKWGLEHRSFKTGSINTINIATQSPIPGEEVFFTNAICSNLKLSYQLDGQSYFSSTLIINAEQITMGRGNYNINNTWTHE